MRSYRRLLAMPGMPSTLLLLFFARIPGAGAAMALTLHVAVGLGHGYAAAGMVGALNTIGIAIGAPFMGRVVDRFGLRRMLIISSIGEAAFWYPSPFMSYQVLLASSLLGGIVVLPAMAIGRQVMTALVPEDQRRTALSLDAIGVELTFMVAPAISVFVSTQFSTRAALIAMGGLTTLAGLALYLANPRVIGEHDIREPVPRRSWLTPRFIAVLVAAAGLVLVLSGQEVALIPMLRGHDQLDWTGAVIATMCVASAIGGLLHGAVRRSFGLGTLLVLLSVLTVPAGLFGGAWWVMALTLAPANLACAPGISATGERVSALTPAAARGEAMGLQASAFTIGAAIGAPLIGFVVDHAHPAWGFAMAGVGGLVMAALALVLSRFGSARPPRPDAPAPSDAGLAEPAPSG